MADIADIANDRAQQMLDIALAARKPAEGGASAEECEDCGGEIPPARRLALAGRGCLRCVECQTFHEGRGGRV